MAHFSRTVCCGQQCTKFSADCWRIGSLNDSRVGQDRNKTVNVNSEVAAFTYNGVRNLKHADRVHSHLHDIAFLQRKGVLGKRRTMADSLVNRYACRERNALLDLLGFIDASSLCDDKFVAKGTQLDYVCGKNKRTHDQ